MYENVQSLVSAYWVTITFFKEYNHKYNNKKL